MKTHSKPIVWLLGGLLAVFAVSVVYQQWRTGHWLKQISDQSLGTLENQEWRNAENVEQSVRHAVAKSLERGEMEKFAQLLEAQRSIQGLQDFSLYDRSGRVTHSSHPARKSQALPAELRDQLLTEGKGVKRRTEGSFEIYRPELIEADCVRCHTGWPPSGIGGVLGFRFSTESLTTAEADWKSTVTRLRHQQLWEGLATAGVIVVCFLVIAIGVMRYQVALPLKRAMAHLHFVAEGDLSHEVPAGLSGRADEVGELSRALQAMTQNLRGMIQGLSGSMTTLGSSSSELSEVSNRMVSGARQTSAKANTVASSAEEMSSNSASVAAAMEQATTSLTTVAASTEEMTSTIGEIATRSEKARVITAEASQQASKVAGLMRELSRAAEAIGKVTETITGISDQTKLLALNATIEAARAGAAGKGFAVVAHEIKELARQTAEATEDIKSRVGGIQTSTHTTLADIERITQVTGEVSEIVNTIAAAIEEQSSVTKDIARHVGEAAAGVKDANERVAQAAVGSRSVASDIAAVNEAAGSMASGSEQTLTSAAELSKLAEDLRQMVARFRVQETDEVSQGGLGAFVAAQTGAGAAGRPFVEWSDDLSVGVTAMDSHHQKLIDLINALHAAMRSGNSRAAVGSALEELAHYVDYHFGAEERLMKAHSCSGLQEQLAAHAGMVAKVTELRRHFASGQFGLGTEVLTMLKDWLISHIQRQDKPCMLECGAQHLARRTRGNGHGDAEEASEAVVNRLG